MLNPLTWIKGLYRNAAAQGLAEFHADLAAAASEAGIDPAKPLTVKSLGELLPRMLPAAPTSPATLTADGPAELPAGDQASSDDAGEPKRRTRR